MSEYGISVQQASQDLQALIKDEPGLMWYDKSEKCYRASVVPTYAITG